MLYNIQDREYVVSSKNMENVTFQIFCYFIFINLKNESNPNKNIPLIIYLHSIQMVCFITFDYFKTNND